MSDSSEKNDNFLAGTFKMPPKDKNLTLEKLNQKYEGVLSLIAYGATTAEAAEIMGFDKGAVEKLIESDFGKQRLSELRHLYTVQIKDARDKLVKGTSKAVDTLLEIMDNGRPAERLKASMELLRTVDIMKGFEPETYNKATFASDVEEAYADSKGEEVIKTDTNGNIATIKDPSVH